MRLQVRLEGFEPPWGLRLRFFGAILTSWGKLKFRYWRERGSFCFTLEGDIERIVSWSKSCRLDSVLTEWAKTRNGG